MAAMSGLKDRKRVQCRDRVVQAAKIGLAHKGDIVYTQGPKRWDGIKNKRNAAVGQFPRHADCSSFVTWCLWNGLFLAYGLSDNVNDQKWQAGFTGTMRSLGRKLGADEDPIRGDLVFYDPPHVAIVVSRMDGVPMVISHGSPGGPRRLRFNYRSPVQVRRYI
jgi:hypothetical protein